MKLIISGIPAFFLVLLFLTANVDASAQSCDGTPPPPPPSGSTTAHGTAGPYNQAPVGDGTWILLGLVMLYGTQRVYSMRKENKGLGSDIA